jgi:hypothetical protein
MPTFQIWGSQDTIWFVDISWRFRGIHDLEFGDRCSFDMPVDIEKIPRRVFPEGGNLEILAYFIIK